MTDNNYRSPEIRLDDNKVEVIHVADNKEPKISRTSKKLQEFIFNSSYELKNLRVFSVISIVFLIASLGVGVAVVQQPQDIGEQAQTVNASLQLLSNAGVVVGQELTVPIMLISDKTPASEVRVAMQFDNEYLELTSIQTYPDFANLDRYHPLVLGEFDEHGVIVAANNSGVVRFRIDSTSGNSLKGVRGADNPLAVLVFKAKKPTDNPTTVGFITTEGASVVVSASTGENILTQTSQMVININ